MSILQDAVGFAIFADTSAVDASLATMEGSAASMASGLEDKLASASDGMKDLGKQSAGASRGIQGVAAVVSLVDPRLGQVIRSVGTLTRGLSVLRLGLGPAAVAVTAVTGALAIYQHQQQQAADEAEAAEQRTRDLTQALQDQHDIYLDLQTQIDLVNGTTDRFAVQFEQRRKQIEEAGQAVTDALDAEIAATEEKIRVQEQERRVSVEQQAVVKGLKEELAELNAERRDAVDATQSQVDAAAALAEYRREEKESAEFLRKREEARREAARKRAEQERENAKQRQEEQRQEEQAQKRLMSMTQELAAIESSAQQAVMSEEQLIVAAMVERLAKLQEITQATQGYVDTSKAELAVRMQAAQKLTELERQQHEKRMEQLKAEQEQQRAAAQQQISMATDIAGATSSLIAQTFQDKKAANVAEGLTSALLAGINTIASNPTPAGFVLAGLNTAAAMAQVSQMRSVTAHRGRLHGAEYMVRARRGEAHLSNMGRQMIGDQDIERANAGQAPQQEAQEVRMFFRHRPHDEFIKDNLKRGGPLIAAINESSEGFGHHRGNRNGA